MQVSRIEIQEMFDAQVKTGRTKRYKKCQNVLARLAVEGEQIDTIINGVLETTNTAKPGQVVIKNISTPSQEEQITDKTIFEKRYVGGQWIADDWVEYAPKGEVDAVQWDGEEIEFEAPWGELMIMHPGDYFCRVPDTTDDVYRIEQSVFELPTYVLAD